MIKFTLLENAIDSIDSGIEQLEQAERTSIKKYYKQSLLNLFQGTELLLKEILVQVNPIIIFDKNTLFRKCNDPLNPTIDELYNCKSIDINDLCDELIRYYPGSFDKIAIKTIEKMAKERNKVQHFALEISAEFLKVNLIQLYGKVIKPSFEIIGYSRKKSINKLGEHIEDLYCLAANADREESILKITKEDFTRGSCFNCDNYSMFIFFDKGSYPTRFYCTSCPHSRKDINIDEYKMCPECGNYSLIFDDSIYAGLCLNYRCGNHKDGGISVEMEYCDICEDYKIEGRCNCR